MLSSTKVMFKFKFWKLLLFTCLSIPGYNNGGNRGGGDPFNGLHEIDEEYGSRVYGGREEIGMEIQTYF